MPERNTNQMTRKPQLTGWRQHFFYRKESLRTTWKFRLGVLFSAILFVPITRGFWEPGLANSLMCEERIVPSSALLIENFDTDFALFEHAKTLQTAGVAPRIFVNVPGSGEPFHPNEIFQGSAEVMAKYADISIEVIPIREVEPISLNSAMQIRDFLVEEHISSIAIVTPGFRSQRSIDIYNAILKPAGITPHCIPVFGLVTPQNWTRTWHGIQDVILQFVKLQYYRFYVMRSVRDNST